MWNCCQYQCCQFSIGNWNWQHWQQWQHSFPLPRQNETTGGASSAACRLESRITRLQSPLRRFSLSLPSPNRSAQTRATRHPGALYCDALECGCHQLFRLSANIIAKFPPLVRRFPRFGQYGILKIIIMTKSRIYNKIWSNWAISFASRVAQAATRRPRSRFRRPTPGRSRWCRTAGPLLCAPRPP